MARLTCRPGIVTTTALAFGAFAAGAGSLVLLSQDSVLDKVQDAVKDAAQDAMDMMDMDPTAMVEQMKQAGQPGPEHKAMTKMVGSWDLKASFLIAPDAPPEISTGTATTEPVLNGLAMLTHTEMDFVFMGETIPMKGIGLMTYNRAKGAYESVWIDTLEPYVLMQSGDMSGDTMSITGSGTSSWGESPMRSEYVFHDNDHYTMTFYQPNPMDPNGEWMKVGEIENTRK